MSDSSASYPQPFPYDDVLDTGADRSPGERARRTVLMLLAALALVLVGAVAAGALLLNRGPQPQDVVPDTALGLVVVDLDPSLGQKVNLVRLVNSLPDGSVTLDEEDPIGSLIDNPQDKAQWDQIKPWVGSKAGLALIPDENGEVSFLVALQVRDEAEATRWLDSQLSEVEDFGGDLSYAFRDGYALVSPSEWLVAQAAATDRVLASSDTFAGDRSILGDQIVWGWLDATRAAPLLLEAAESELGTASGLSESLGLDVTDEVEDVKGRYMFGISAQPSALALTLKSKDANAGDVSWPAFLEGSNLAEAVPTNALMGLGMGGISIDSSVVEELISSQQLAGSASAMSSATAVARNASSLWALYARMPAGTRIESYAGDHYCVSTCSPEDILTAALLDSGLLEESLRGETSVASGYYSLAGTGADVTAVITSGSTPEGCALVRFSAEAFVSEEMACPDVDTSQTDSEGAASRIVSLLAAPVSLYVVPQAAASDSLDGLSTDELVVLLRVPESMATDLASALTDTGIAPGEDVVVEGGFAWTAISVDGLPVDSDTVRSMISPESLGEPSVSIPAGGLVGFVDVGALKERGFVEGSDVGPLSAGTLSVTSGENPGDGTVEVTLTFAP